MTVERKSRARRPTPKARPLCTLRGATVLLRLLKKMVSRVWADSRWIWEMDKNSKKKE
jgi:hypothetical protein